MSASASQGLRTCPLLLPVEICSDSRRTSLFHGVSYSVPLRACCSVMIILDTPVNNSGFRISNGKVHRPGCPFDSGPGKIKLWEHLLFLFSSLFRSTSNALPAPWGGGAVAVQRPALESASVGSKPSYITHHENLPSQPWCLHLEMKAEINSRC